MSKAPRGYAHLVADTSVQETELDLAEGLEARAQALARRHGWDRDWGEDAPLVILYHGLAARELEQAERCLDTTDSVAIAREVARLRGRLNWLDGKYAVLRFHLHELIKNNQIMAMRERALRIDNDGLRRRLERFRRERIDLERSLGTGLSHPAGEGSPTTRSADGPSASRGHDLVGRLRCWLSGREPQPGGPTDTGSGR